MARRIRQVVPEAKIGVAHGRMPSRELEDVMVKFLRREYDVLLCTTIVGSGIDIPAANTIIVDRADRFGLAQLYQIRGRVGRSREEARAYLLIPPGAMLSPDAQKRLTVIKEFTEPGSGFRIASQDLEIRGAGNLMGMAQSGHISAWATKCTPNSWSGPSESCGATGCPRRRSSRRSTWGWRPSCPTATCPIRTAGS